MKILKILGVIWFGFSVVAGLFVYRTFAFENNQQVDQPYAYQLINQSENLKLAPDAPGWLIVAIRNVGQEGWLVKDLRMGAVYFDGTPGRTSRFATSAWEKGALIMPTTDQSVIEPMGKVKFEIPIQAVGDSVVYKETFRPVVNGNWINGATIEWLIQVGEGVTAQEATAAPKQIKISLDQQRLWAIEDHVVVMDVPVSTGKSGYATPKGIYTVARHVDRAYSTEWKLYMENWLGLAGPNSKKLLGYGIHKLPSWRANPAAYRGKDGQYIGSRYYENGWIYEDATHLGKRMSHGCIRVGIQEAPVLYNWAKDGTVVEIS